MKPLSTLALLLFSLSGLFCRADTGEPLSVSTPTRPQLASTEQSSYTMATFLDGWVPEDVCTPDRGDYVVGGKGAYATVQAAVNAAIEAGGTVRKYIEIQPGTYTGLVVIPSGVPLTLFGSRDRREEECRDPECRHAGRRHGDHRGHGCGDGVTRNNASDVVLQLNAHDVMTGPELVLAVNDSEDFGPSAPAKVSSYYNDCTTRAILGTNCTATVISYASNLEIKNLTILNSYQDDDPNANGQNQAVAYLNNGGDEVILDHVRLISFQDTLWLNGSGKRTYVRNSFVSGDTDFIFGDMVGVFDRCDIHYVTTHKTSGSITAPSHLPTDFGFLFSGGAFTSDGGTINTVYLGRQWPQNNNASTGQTIIRGAWLDDHIRSLAPWKQWDSTHPIDYGATGNWRLAEYRNFGPGAAP